MYFNAQDRRNRISDTGQSISGSPLVEPELTVLDMAQALGFTHTYLCAAYKKAAAGP